MQHSEEVFLDPCIMHQRVSEGLTSARGEHDQKGGMADTPAHSADIGTALEKGDDHAEMAFHYRRVQRHPLVPECLA
jgi:hypothetical protein